MPGTKFTLALLVGAVLLASSSAHDACKGDKKSSGNNPAVAAAFERLKKLSGDWVLAAPVEGAAKGELGVRYRVTAGGSAVVETVFPGGDMEMVTVYHRDGDHLALTHYCMLGNQPRMRAKPAEGSNELFFEFAGGCNIDPAKDQHMHQARIHFVDDDHLRNEWELFADGKSAGKHTVELVRKKSQEDYSHKQESFMAKFMFVYRGGEENTMTPEEMQQNMQQWGAWIGKALQKGWMTDPGDALTPEGRVVNAKKVVTDGPFVESKEIIGGYSVVEAASIDAAAELAKGCPGLVAGGKVEVRTLAGLAANL